FGMSNTGQPVATSPRVGAGLNEMLTNNIDKLEVGTGQYTFLLNDRGGIIDDLIVYRTAPDEFLLVVNASRVDEDFAWLRKHLGDNGRLDNRSADYGGLAIQGTRMVGLLQSMLSKEAELRARNQLKAIECCGTRGTVPRTR